MFAGQTDLVEEKVGIKKPASGRIITGAGHIVSEKES